MNTEITKEKKYTIEQLGTKLEKLESKIKKIKELEVEYDTFKEKMYEAMNENGCTKYISPNRITFTSVAPTQDKTELKVEFDTEKIKTEEPKLYKQYTHVVEKVTKGKKGYLRVTIPKEDK